MPPDLAICSFILEQSLSVRALQEMLANTVEMTEVGVITRIKKVEEISEYVETFDSLTNKCIQVSVLSWDCCPNSTSAPSICQRNQQCCNDACLLCLAPITGRRIQPCPVVHFTCDK